MDNTTIEDINDSIEAYHYVYSYMLNHPDTPVPYYNDMLQLMIQEQNSYAAYHWALKICRNIDEMANIVILSNDSHMAFHWANRIKTHISEMARIIIQNNDAHYAGEWIKHIKTHMDEMFNIVINSANLNTFCFLIDELKYEYDRELNKAIRIKIVELGLVDDFVERYQLRLNRSYSFNDFYDGLSDEHKIGVIV